MVKVISRFPEARRFDQIVVKLGMAFEELLLQEKTLSKKVNLGEMLGSSRHFVKGQKTYPIAFAAKGPVTCHVTRYILKACFRSSLDHSSLPHVSSSCQHTTYIPIYAAESHERYYFITFQVDIYSHPFLSNPDLSSL